MNPRIDVPLIAVLAFSLSMALTGVLLAPEVEPVPTDGADEPNRSHPASTAAIAISARAAVKILSCGFDIYALPLL